MHSHLGIVAETLFEGRLEEQMRPTHALGAFIKLAEEGPSREVKLVHFVDENLVALFAFVLV